MTERPSLRNTATAGSLMAPVYGLIERAIDNLSAKLIEEFIVVAAVCAIFLWHLRSALVVAITLPVAILLGTASPSLTVCAVADVMAAARPSAMPQRN